MIIDPSISEPHDLLDMLTDQLNKTRREIDKMGEQVAEVMRERNECVAALVKCHEELVGYLAHEGGDLMAALRAADKALAKKEPKH